MMNAQQGRRILLMAIFANSLLDKNTVADPLEECQKLPNALWDVNAGRCAMCLDCVPGTGYTGTYPCGDGVVGHRGVCNPCNVGEFQSEHGQLKCTICTQCSDLNRAVIQSCSHELMNSYDTVCGDCLPGYASSPDSTRCVSCSDFPDVPGCPTDEPMTPGNSPTMTSSHIVPPSRIFANSLLDKSQDIEKSCTGENVYYNRESNICTECPSTCPAGHGYFKVKCGYGKMDQERCTECTAESGTFSSANDSSRCMPCKICVNRQIISQCTPTSDSKCGPCNDGYGWDNVRNVCKQCQHARKQLPGCEESPKISTEKNVVYICDSVSTPDKYSWFRNDELLDTTDEKKYVAAGKILVVKSELDFGVYKCRAEWNANSHNYKFEIKKMSSNNVTSWPTYEQKYEGIDVTTITDSSTSENQYTEPTTKPRPVAYKIVKLNCLKSGVTWIFCAAAFVVGVFIPNTCLILVLRRLWNKMNLRCIWTDESGECSVFVSSSSESESVGLEVATAQNPSEMSNLIQTTVPETDLETIYKNALTQSSGLHYNDLDINTTDRLEMLLNPRVDPKPPIKFWKHLACELGVNDSVVVNSLGSYKDFHNYLQTQFISMETFLKALWRVGNIEATKIVCLAVLEKKV